MEYEALIDLDDLHPAQQTILDDPARFKVLACGRRFGKTTVAMDAICNHLLDGESVAYFAPTFRMTKEVWEELKGLLGSVIKRVNEHDMRLDLHTGGTLECWSLMGQAGETVRGRKYHFAVIDEAAIVPDGRLWQAAIRPLLTDHKGGALFCSTPRGRNWFWSLFVRGQDAAFPAWASWQFPTIANPHIDPDEVEDARRGLPEQVFQQEYLAQFLEDGGTVFRNLSRICVGERESDPVPDHRYVFGVDWGRHVDFTCISVMDVERKQQVYLDRFTQINWATQRNRLMALYERFRPDFIYAEENSIGSVNIEALQDEGLPMYPYTTTAKSKPELIEALQLAMEQEKVTLLNDAVLINELQNYEMSRLANGGWRYSAPPGGHDDTVIATALSLWGAQRSRRLLFFFA